jgi:hypothetical protein
MSLSKHNLIAQHHRAGLKHGTVSIMFAIVLCFWVRVKWQENPRDARNIIKVPLCTLSLFSLFITSSSDRGYFSYQPIRDSNI